MKRTKENWLFGHPEDRSEISGLRKFDGEDLHHQERKKAQQETQKRWLEEQKAEKERKKQQEAEDERMYAFQTLQANRLRGMLEDQLENNKRVMQASTRDANIQLRKEKEFREKVEKDTRIRYEDEELGHQARIREVPPYANPLQ